MTAARAERGSRDERFLVDPARAGWLGVGLLALVCLGGVLVSIHTPAFDESWWELMQDIRTPLLTDIALVFNAVGRGVLRALSVAGIATVLLVGRRWAAAIAFALAEGVTPLTSTLMKVVVDRPRPPDQLVTPSGSSFPSGHAAYAGATCVALVLLFTAAGRGRRRWCLPAAAGILTMAWSRTYLHAHWLSDVLAGSVLGIAVSLLSFAVVQLVTRRRRDRKAAAPGHARTAPLRAFPGRSSPG
jgi:membrane-associated phospholipid phosphatase